VNILRYIIKSCRIFQSQNKGVMHMNGITIFFGIQMKWLALLVGIFCLSFAAAASAEQNTHPCVDDAAKLCKGVEKGEGRIAKCLKEHEKELSSACKANIGKMKEEVREAKEACEGDAKKLCKDAKPGEGRILQCLKQHESELSTGCKEKIEHPRGNK
jgi:hypothetical protein